MPIGRRGFPRDKGARELVCKSQSAAPSMQVGSWIACKVCCWFGAHGQCFNGLHHECSVAQKPTKWDRVSPFCSMLIRWWDSLRSVTERRGRKQTLVDMCVARWTTRRRPPSQRRLVFDATWSSTDWYNLKHCEKCKATRRSPPTLFFSDVPENK